MRTTLRLSDDSWRRARKKAAEQDRTLTSLLEEGLKSVLAESKTGETNARDCRFPKRQAEHYPVWTSTDRATSRTGWRIDNPP